MKKIIFILVSLVFVMVGCSIPFNSPYQQGGLYGSQFGVQYGMYNSGYGYDNYQQQRTVTIQEVGRNSKIFAAEAEIFHQNITGMRMCANGGTKADSAATATGTVTDNSGRINYQIATMSNTMEVCNDLQIQMRKVK